MGAVSPGLEQMFGCRTSGRQDDMFPDADRVASEPQRVILRDGELPVLRNSLGNRGLTIGIEGRREIEQISSAQGAEASVEMVKASIDEFERNNFPMKSLAQEWEDADI